MKYLAQEFAPGLWRVNAPNGHPVYDGARDGKDKPVVFTDVDLAVALADQLNAEMETTTITPKADAVRPLRTELPEEIVETEWQWLSEGDGFTLYRINESGDRGRNCGRLNTGATGSTHNLATLYNSSPRILRERNACLDALILARNHLIMSEGCFVISGKVGQSSDWQEALSQVRDAIALCEKGQT